MPDDATDGPQEEIHAESEVDTDRPAGPVRFGRFEGVLEGRATDPNKLRRLVQELNKVGLVRIDLEIDGGRFALFADDASIDGNRFDGGRENDFLSWLEQIVDTAGDLNTIESTLRCTAVHDDTVRETLFTALEGRLQAITRTRALRESDRQQAPPTVWAASLSSFGKSRAITIGVLFVVGTLLLAWQRGLIDRAFRAGPSALTLETGPFGEMLSIEVETHWGNYRAHVRRGRTYPETVEQIDRMRNEAASGSDRAAVDKVSAGGTVYVQVLNRDGKVLAYESIELAALLESDDAKVTAPLPGLMSAHTVRIALGKGGGDPGS